LREYETNCIVQPEISDEGIATLRERFEGILERSGADRLAWDDQGKRRLAYEIESFQKGHYLVLSYLDDGKVVRELERVARMEESVIRFLTILANEEVIDLEARKKEAAELEEERNRKAAEAAAREAEEAAERAAREEEERRAAEERAAAETEKQAAEAERRAAEGETPGEGETPAEGETQAGGEESGDEAEAPEGGDEGEEKRSAGEKEE